MWKKRSVLLIALAIVIGLSLIKGLSSGITALTVFAIIISGYIIRIQLNRNKRLKKLNSDLDPEAFILGTEKQILTMGNILAKTKALLLIDLAVGYMANGENEKALESLDRVNQKKLSVKNRTKLMYNINRILCLCRLERIDEAEALFDAEIEAIDTTDNYVKQGVDRVLCELYYYLERYKHFRDVSESLMAAKSLLSLRTELELKYRMAQVAELEGNKESAERWYHEIVEGGNGLWIVKVAKEKLEV